MGTSKLEIMWSPLQTNKFITWSNDIYLYEVRPKKDHGKPSDINISENTIARLVSTNSNYRYVKCIDIHPRYENDMLLAVGQANGKVCLATFGSSVFDSMGLAGLELGARYPRQCNSLMWNPVDNNLLATGFEKHRSDHSIQVWDVMKSPFQPNSYSASGSQGAPDTIRPIIEIGLSDTAHSISWLNQSANTLVAGINSRNLKVIDIRDVTKAVLSTPTKAVNGVAVSPYNDNCLASCGENVISLWDLRNLEKSILVITQHKIATKVSWCPTRRNLLGSLIKESAAIHLHDMQQSTIENEPSVLGRSVQPGQNSPLTSFSWHPKDENRLIAICFNGSIIDYLVFERMTLNWSPSTHIVWTYGRRHLKMISEKDRLYNKIQDLGIKIKKRARALYGLKEEFWQNAEVSDDEALYSVWHWLYLSRSLVEDGIIEMESDIKHPGVRCVLGLDNHTTMIQETSEIIYTQWTDVDSSVMMYRSSGRDNALQLCGWKFDKDGSFLDRLELEGRFSRAAAVAIFNLKLREAIEILNRGDPRHQPHLAMTAMALSGYSSEKKSLWRELCINTKKQLSDPYLKAAFTFLAVESADTYGEILDEPGLAIEDRIAFACTFLSDSQLNDYLINLTSLVYEEGDITGLVLTGTCDNCLPLLQSYLDVTGDVQSVSLIAVRALSSDLIHDDTSCQTWINSYRCLLDCWRLWNERAQFDILLNADKIPPEQVFVSCNFCGKSISASMQQDESQANKSSATQSPCNKAKSVQNDGTVGQNNSPTSTHDNNRMTSCPHCHKPLPRCAICLGNMGTLSTFSGKDIFKENSTVKVADFSSWFTWCQTCRHGGHAGHITQWFEEHIECPVTGCVCHCLALDNP